MKNLIEILRNEGKPKTFGAIDIIKNIGPGLLVTVGFIDPGNWASNFAAGSKYRIRKIPKHGNMFEWRSR